MLEIVLNHINNYFIQKTYKGEFVIKEGKVGLPTEPLTGQYIHIEGSVFYDGVSIYPLPPNMIEEVFVGVVHLLRIPPQVHQLVREIEVFYKKNPPSGYIAENFGGYSYNKATNQEGGVQQWQDVFKRELNRYRKI